MSLNLPPHILADINTMAASGQNALIISKIIEQKYGEEIAKLKLTIPTFSQIDKYIKETKKARAVKQATDIVKHTDNSMVNFSTDNGEVPATLDFDNDVESGAHKLSSFDKNLTTKVNLSSVKDTNADLKQKIADTIARMENQRTQFPETFTDKDEDRLQRYYDMLSKHNLSEIKVAEALKDQDVLDTPTVVFFINKLFSSMKTCVDKYVPTENRERFILDLKNIISSTGDEGAKVIMKKLEVKK